MSCHPNIIDFYCILVEFGVFTTSTTICHSQLAFSSSKRQNIIIFTTLSDNPPPTKSILKPFLTLFYIWIKLNFNEIRFFLFDTIAQTIWSYFISRNRINLRYSSSLGADSFCFCFVNFCLYPAMWFIYIFFIFWCDLYLEICPC